MACSTPHIEHAAASIASNQRFFAFTHEFRCWGIMASVVGIRHLVVEISRLHVKGYFKVLREFSV